MHAIRQYVTTPIAETLYRKFVDPITRYIAEEMERTPIPCYMIIFASAFSGVGYSLLGDKDSDLYTEKYTFPATGTTPILTCLLLEILRRTVVPEEARGRGLTLRDIISVTAFTAHGYFGSYLCIEGIKIVAKNIFNTVQQF